MEKLKNGALVTPPPPPPPIGWYLEYQIEDMYKGWGPNATTMVLDTTWYLHLLVPHMISRDNVSNKLTSIQYHMKR